MSGFEPDDGSTFGFDDGATRPGDDEAVRTTAPFAFERAAEGPVLTTSERYHDLGLLGRGGMGEVRRVRDRLLNRVMAMKILDARLAGSSTVLRFVEEAQATSQLQHPGIVPIHDLGRLEDGRWYYTMRLVGGTDFGRVLAAGGQAWPLRRLVRVLQDACEAMAYAHSRRVVHRDLKPENLMVGDFGEVLVVDFGLAKILVQPESVADEEEQVVTARSREHVLATRMGQVAGTPAYMAPEQARGQIDQVGPHSDVFALGCILYEILYGRRAFDGTDVQQILAAVRHGRPERPPVLEPGLPEQLVEVCAAALAPDIADRPRDATWLAEELGSWLDGARARQRARELLAEAETCFERAAAVQVEAEAERRAQKRVQVTLAAGADLDRLRLLWPHEDRARELELEGAVQQAQAVDTLHAALSHHDDPAIHQRLADHLHAQHRRAEARHDVLEAGRLELLLRRHDRGRHADYLDGRAWLTLTTDPPGATVTLHRLVERDRRLVPDEGRRLGVTPLAEVPVQAGRYVAVLEAPGRHAVRYPIHLDRLDRWAGIAPGEHAPRPIHLPPLGSLDPDACYVPAGWFLADGDRDTEDPLTPERLWVEGFVLRRYPITLGEYAAYLDDLVARGQEAEAWERAPRNDGSEERVLVLGDDGRHRIDPAQDLSTDHPVTSLDVASAAAYAAWLAARTGLPWRLPGRYEWQKAARGVDARHFPWGDRFVDAYCNNIRGRPAPQLEPVGGRPEDESPYGVRDLGGNARDWTATVARPTRAEVVDQVVQVEPVDPAAVDPSAAYWQVGGLAQGRSMYARTASRGSVAAGYRFNGCGLRLARTLPTPR